MGSARAGAVAEHWSIRGRMAAAKAQPSAQDFTQSSLAVRALLPASAKQSSPFHGSALHAYLSMAWMSGIDICLMISSITGSASSHLAAMMRSRPLMNSARISTFTVAGPVE